MCARFPGVCPLYVAVISVSIERSRSTLSWEEEDITLILKAPVKLHRIRGRRASLQRQDKGPSPLCDHELYRKLPFWIGVFVVILPVFNIMHLAFDAIML